MINKTNFSSILHVPNNRQDDFDSYKDASPLGRPSQDIESLYKHTGKREEHNLLGSFFGKIWNLPNTAIGLAWGLIGLPFGAKMSFGNNALQFENHPFMDSYGGITLGNVIAYGSNTSPHEIGDHERQHTYQGEVLGPLYLFAHLYEGAQALVFDGSWHGPSNDLEKGPMHRHNPNPWRGELNE